MNTDRTKQFALTVRLGHYERCTQSDGKVVRRSIRLFDCPVIGTNLKGEGQPARGDEIELSIYESDEQSIGKFDSLAFLTLSLFPPAFAEFWTASAAADGMVRDVTILFSTNVEARYYEISKAYLVEHMPGDTSDNPKRRGGRPHPVVAELKDIRRAVTQSWQSAVAAISVIIGIAVVCYLIRTGIRAIWHILQSG